jgi:hypothetical protein
LWPLFTLISLSLLPKLHPTRLFRVRHYAFANRRSELREEEFGSCGLIFQELGKLARLVITMACTLYCSIKVMAVAELCVPVSFVNAVSPVLEEKQHIQAILKATCACRIFSLHAFGEGGLCRTLPACKLCLGMISPKNGTNSSPWSVEKFGCCCLFRSLTSRAMFRDLVHHSLVPLAREVLQ